MAGGMSDGGGFRGGRVAGRVLIGWRMLLLSGGFDRQILRVLFRFNQRCPSFIRTLSLICEVLACGVWGGALPHEAWSAYVVFSQFNVCKPFLFLLSAITFFLASTLICLLCWRRLLFIHHVLEI